MNPKNNIQKIINQLILKNFNKNENKTLSDENSFL
jgi:hypothetical protein